MRMSNRVRGALATVAAATLLVTGVAFASPAAIALTPPPTAVRMAALGDSITLGTSSCSGFGSCLANSWATGTSASVGSHALRLKAIQPAGSTFTSFTFAVNGANSGALNAQAVKAVGQSANYVTIEIGANDACTRTVSAMTAPATFESNIRTALGTLSASSAKPEILVASIPNLHRMYDLNKSSSSARITWGLLQICQSMLANPTSTKTADVQRRLAVQAQVDRYNAILAAACSQTPKCRFDGGAVANYQFVKTDISTRDYFHPSLAGQTTLARITWERSQWVS